MYDPGLIKTKQTVDQLGIKDQLKLYKPKKLNKNSFTFASGLRKFGKPSLPSTYKPNLLSDKMSKQNSAFPKNKTFENIDYDLIFDVVKFTTSLAYKKDQNLKTNKGTPPAKRKTYTDEDNQQDVPSKPNTW